MITTTGGGQLATRLPQVRKIRGLSQQALAELSGVSYSMIRKIEQGEAQPRIGLVRKLAVALRVSTSDLLAGDTEPADTLPPAEIWAPTLRALIGQHDQPATDEPTPDGVRRTLEGLKPLFAANQYDQVAQILPGLIRDAEALTEEGRPLRSRVLNTAGWVLTQTRHLTLAEATLRQAIDTADDRLDAAAAADTLAWVYLRQGRLDDASRLATKWADDIEPRMSRATIAELEAWGRLLIRVSSAAIRDNRPGEADAALRLAHAAAALIGREVPSNEPLARAFGPISVAMIRAEHAAIMDRPDRVLTISSRIAQPRLYATAAARNRHRLDVAAAYVSTGHPDKAASVLTEVARHSPQWIREQRYARDIVSGMVNRRRTLNPEMLGLVDAVGLTL